MPANLENPAVATGLEKVSFPSNPKERQCHTIELISHVSKVMLKILQARLQSMWTMNFQMFKLDLEKAEEPEIKLPTSAGSSKKQENYAKAFFCVTHKKLWKIEEMGITDHLTCLLRNLYTGQEATVKTRNGTADWFNIWTGVHQSCIFSPCLFNNLYAECNMWNAGWLKHKLESRFPGEISITSDIQMTPPLWQKVKN